MTTAVEQPVHTWRQRVAEAGAIVARPWRRYRARVFQGYLIAAIVIFAILAFLAHTVAYFTFDVTITHDVQAYSPFWFDALMRFLSNLGFAPQVDILAGLIILFLYVTGLKWEGVVTFLGAVTISLLGGIIKLLVDRPRPASDLVRVFAQLHDHSFPSGHVLFYTVFYGFLLFLAYTLLKHSWGRTLLLFAFGGLVALIGISRIYLGEHWASDVLAAYLLGTVWLSLTVYVYRWGKPRYFVNQPVAKETGTESAPAPATVEKQ